MDRRIAKLLIAENQRMIQNVEWGTVFVKRSPFSFKYEKKVTGNRAIITKCWENGVFFGKKFGGFMDNA